MSELTVNFRPARELVPYARNARRHSSAQVEKIALSISKWGWTNPILADGSNVVAGHGRLMAAERLYDGGATIRLPSGDEIPEGTVPVIDCSGWPEADRRAYVLADNRLAEISSWDDELVGLELEELAELGVDVELTGFELEALDPDARKYSPVVETPVYTPKGDRPELEDLVDRSRAVELIAEIEDSEVPDEVRRFLRTAASRHLRFDYEAIAEYYCHAPPEVKRLIEASALVIIDIDDAIASGYADLTEKFQEIYADGHDS